jgi:hypothetical protein
MAVVYDQLLAEAGGDPLTDRPRHDVGRPARGERHDQPQRPGRVGIVRQYWHRGRERQHVNQYDKADETRLLKPA